MRLADLGRWPLAAGEAALALEAFRFVSGQPYQMAGLPIQDAVLSPLAFNLDALLFLLLGASDTSARIAQALGGVGLLLAPWLLRPLLGRGHALAMGVLLLLSPTALFFSRHASGDVWAALASLLLVAGVARWHRWGAARDAVLAALALGLGLASGPGIWSVLLAGALFLVWQRRSRHEAGQRAETEGEPQESAPAAWAVPLRPLPAFALPLALATFVVAATGLFTNLSGVGAALNLPIQWANGLLGAGPPLAVPFLFALLLYEMLPLAASLAAAPAFWEARPGWARFAFLWVGVTLLPATLTNSGWSGALLMLLLPLALVGAAALVRLVAALLAAGRWRVEGAFLVGSLALLMYFWLALTKFLADARSVNALAMVVPFGLLLVMVALVWQSLGRGAAFRALGLTLLASLTIFSLTSSWGLAMVRGADPREPLVTQPSDADLRTAAARLAQLSIERYRDPAAMPLAIQRTLGHAPHWYFRAFDSIRSVEGSSPDLPEAALLADDVPPPPGWIGQRIWTGPAWQWSLASPQSLLGWLALRSDESGVTERAAVLYVRLAEP